MSLIDLRLSLELQSRLPTPEVRAFIDLQPELGLGSERELPLRQRGREWVGTFAIGEVGPRSFLYRVALAAHRGARWDLAIYERRSGATLLADSDTLELTKCWLVGSCDGPQAPARTPTGALGSAGGASACRLLVASPGFRPSRHLALQRLEATQHGEPQNDGARDAPQQERLFVLRELRDERVRAVNERLRKPERNDRGV
jgi:hypothetical protein